MEFHLTAEYQTITLFHPVYSLCGKLVSVEVTTQFNNDSASVTLPQSLLSPQLDLAQRLHLLQHQLSIVQDNQDFFQLNQVDAVLPLDAEVAEGLPVSELLQHRLAQLPSVILSISEDFPQLAVGEEHPLLTKLSAQHRLGIAQFGSGKAPATAIYDRLFCRVKIDKGFIHGLAKRASFRPFILTIVENIRPYCHQIVIDGIDDERLLMAVSHLDPALVSVKGKMFPPVMAENLSWLRSHHDGLLSPAH